VSTLADIYAEILQGVAMFLDAISGCICIHATKIISAYRIKITDLSCPLIKVGSGYRIRSGMTN
jgi:hypothetical protein